MSTDLPDPFVVGICYPLWWWDEPGAPEAAKAALVEAGVAAGVSVEVIEPTYEETHERRASRGYQPEDDWRASQPEVAAETDDGFARVHAVVALDLPADIADRAPNLRWVQAFGAGSDQLLSCHLPDADITLTNSAGANAIGIAEFALGRVIEHRKRFASLRELQRDKHWQPLYGAELAGTTLGLIGFGNICAAVAPRARAFDMRVVACRRSAQPGDTHPELDALWPTADLHEMLGECDAVIAAVPNSPETSGLIDADALAAMKPGAYFVNVGRGTLVDEPALVAALESGHLSGAALDVASSEPLPEDSPIWTAPNLSLSFHNAAVPGAMFGNVHRLFAANLARYLAGEPLHNLVH